MLRLFGEREKSAAGPPRAKAEVSASLRASGTRTFMVHEFLFYSLLCCRCYFCAFFAPAQVAPLPTRLRSLSLFFLRRERAMQIILPPLVTYIIFSSESARTWRGRARIYACNAICIHAIYTRRWKMSSRPAGSSFCIVCSPFKL